MPDAEISGLGKIGEPSHAAALERRGGPDDTALMKACREFEAFFVREVLSRAGVDSALRGGLFTRMGVAGREGTGDEGASGIDLGTDLYAEQALDAIARSLASGGCLGLAELLYRQLTGWVPSLGAGKGGSDRGAGDKS